MKIAIVGSRKISDAEAVYKIISESIPPECTEIVSGGAVGVDRLAERYAEEKGIGIKRFLPDYEKYGHSAPLRRNIQIVEYADIVYAFWDMESRGTKHTLNKCMEKGKPFKIIKI